MITCSAPGKVYLFGEHAVVYGEMAICCAIDIRTYVTVETVAANTIIIDSVLGSTGLDHEIHPYVSAVVEKIFTMVPERGLNISITSSIPVGSGLGSSAAVTVATIKALDELYGIGLTLEEIAHMGHEIEVSVQGAASPTDTYVCTMGGVFMIPQCKRLSLIECGFIIGNTNIFASTGKLVRGVAELKERYPEVLGPILSCIGKLSLTGERFVNEKNYPAVGELMDINQGLLDAIGVGGIELSSFIDAARKGGALGAKITGAGGGGCMFALVGKADLENVCSNIKCAGGDVLMADGTDTGVMVEISNLSS